MCTTILVLLFEAALCLGKVLVEMTAADGILWENFAAPIDKVKRLVSPDYIPAFQGGEELAQEKQPETQVANQNTWAMILPGQVQGGLPYTLIGGDRLGGDRG